jgi:cytochrome c-type biogenesis protein
MKVAQTALFALTRALFIGGLGIGAVLVGSVFLGFQKGAWVVLGVVYVALGAAYLTGRSGALMRALGPGLARLSGLSGSAVLGVLFGLNIPACAAPLLFVLLGAAAAGGTGGATLAEGFVSLGLFGFALSLPLVAAVLFAPARSLLDRIAGLSRRMPVWTGLVMIVLGLWSIGLGLFLTLAPPA